MTDQPTLPYTKGSKTSQAAAESMRPHAPTVRHRVYQHILAQGEQGTIDEEVCDALGGAPSTTRTRRQELEQMGAVKMTTRTRPTRSGCASAVYVAIPGVDIGVRRGRPTKGDATKCKRVRVHLTRAEYADLCEMAAKRDIEVGAQARDLVVMCLKTTAGGAGR